jgi:hypothetical protein
LTLRPDRTFEVRDPQGQVTTGKYAASGNALNLPYAERSRRHFEYRIDVRGDLKLTPSAKDQPGQAALLGVLPPVLSSDKGRKYIREENWRTAGKPMPERTATATTSPTAPNSTVPAIQVQFKDTIPDFLPGNYRIEEGGVGFELTLFAKGNFVLQGDREMRSGGTYLLREDQLILDSGFHKRIFKLNAMQSPLELQRGTQDLLKPGDLLGELPPQSHARLTWLKIAPPPDLADLVKQDSLRTKASPIVAQGQKMAEPMRKLDATASAKSVGDPGAGAIESLEAPPLPGSGASVVKLPPGTAVPAQVPLPSASPTLPAPKESPKAPLPLPPKPDPSRIDPGMMPPPLETPSVEAIAQAPPPPPILEAQIPPALPSAPPQQVALKPDPPTAATPSATAPLAQDDSAGSAVSSIPVVPIRLQDLLGTYRYRPSPLVEEFLEFQADGFVYRDSNGARIVGQVKLVGARLELSAEDVIRRFTLSLDVPGQLLLRKASDDDPKILNDLGTMSPSFRDLAVYERQK